jgi:hypothetical protein
MHWPMFSPFFKTNMSVSLHLFSSLHYHLLLDYSLPLDSLTWFFLEFSPASLLSLFHGPLVSCLGSSSLLTLSVLDSTDFKLTVRNLYLLLYHYPRSFWWVSIPEHSNLVNKSIGFYTTQLLNTLKTELTTLPGSMPDYQFILCAEIPLDSSLFLSPLPLTLIKFLLIPPGCLEEPPILPTWDTCSQYPAPNFHFHSFANIASLE